MKDLLNLWLSAKLISLIMLIAVVFLSTLYLKATDQYKHYQNTSIDDVMKKGDSINRLNKIEKYGIDSYYGY